MKLLYDAFFLLFGLVSLPRALSRRMRNPAYKGMLARRLRSPFPRWTPGLPRIWINGVSVGEVASAQPLVAELEKRFLGIRLVISSTTGTGFARATALYGKRHEVLAYPLDFSFVVSSFLRALNPDIVVSMELDLWPNFLTCCKERGIPLVVAGGRLSEFSTRGYVKARRILAGPLSAVTFFLAQDKTDAERAARIGIDPARIEVGGNLKFDLLPEKGAPLAPPFSGIAASGRKHLVLASTHHPEEEMIFKELSRIGWKERFAQWRIIFAPRHPERASELIRLAEKEGYKAVLFKDLAAGNASDWDLLVIDRIGVLLPAFRASELAFVGGSLIPHGGQNMIEPAALGLPIFFGPSVENFREASAALLSEGAAVQVEDAHGFGRVLEELASSEERRKDLGAKAGLAIERKKGAAKYAADRICSIIEEKNRGKEVVQL